MEFQQTKKIIMKLKANNFKGNINLDYRVYCEETPGEAVVHLQVKAPHSETYYHVDCSIGTGEKDYKNNLRSALLRAEEKWGLELVRLDIDLKTA